MVPGRFQIFLLFTEAVAYVFSDEKLQVLQIFLAEENKGDEICWRGIIPILQVGFVAGYSGKVQIPSDRNAAECILTTATTGLWRHWESPCDMQGLLLVAQQG